MQAATTPLRACAIVLAVIAVAGCANSVVPPAEPREPAAAFLLDHGGSSSLLLERDDGFSRYSYGHWGWYVENRKGPLRATGALFGSGTAGIGRKRLPGPADPDTVLEQVRVPVLESWRFEVPADRANALHERFDRLFRERADELTGNPRYDLEFVPHPDDYRIGNNSNHMTARWLRELGCEVRMASPYSSWTVERPPQ